MRVHTVHVCIVFQSHRGWGSLSDPAQGSSSSLSGLAAPSLGPLALLSKLQSSFKNKEPLRPIRLSRQTLHRQCVTNSTLTLSWTILFCVSSFFSFYIFYFTSALTFGEFSQLFPPLSCLTPCFLLLHFPPIIVFFLSSLSVVLFFCFSLLISMVTVRFPGIMEAGGLGGVKADGWLSHK